MAGYCRECGAPCEERIPPGEDRPRSVCSSCDHVHYRNPLVVVGCIVEVGEELLLCERSIEPAAGKWTFPAGFLELGESLVEGAARETREEARAEVDVHETLALLDVPHIGQTYVVFRATLRGAEFGAGFESADVRLFGLDAVPWGELAFPSVATALRLYAEDRRAGVRRQHRGEVRWSGEGSRFDLARYALEGHATVDLERHRPA